MNNLDSVEVGQKVRRFLGGAGGVEMVLEVTHVSSTKIECGWWIFDKATGAEIDEDLGWGPPPLATGSFITP